MKQKQIKPRYIHKNAIEGAFILSQQFFRGVNNSMYLVLYHLWNLASAIFSVKIGIKLI